MYLRGSFTLSLLLSTIGGRGSRICRVYSITIQHQDVTGSYALLSCCLPDSLKLAGFESSWVELILQLIQPSEPLQVFCMAGCFSACIQSATFRCVSLDQYSLQQIVASQT